MNLHRHVATDNGGVGDTERVRSARRTVRRPDSKVIASAARNLRPSSCFLPRPVEEKTIRAPSSVAITAVERREQDAVAGRDARGLLREANRALDAWADRPPGAGGDSRCRPGRRKAGRPCIHPRSAGRGRRGVRASSGAGTLLRRRCPAAQRELVCVEEIERFLAGPSLSDATRKAYRSDLEQFGAWLERRGLALEDVDVRVLTEYAAELGRRRPKLAAATSPASSPRSGRCSRSLSAPSRVPDAALAPKRARRLPSAPKTTEVDALLEELRGRRRARPPEPRARRADLLGRPAQRRGGRPRPPGRGLRAGARPRPRQGRQGAHGAARRGGCLPSFSLSP